MFDNIMNSAIEEGLACRLTIFLSLRLLIALTKIYPYIYLIRDLSTIFYVRNVKI